MQLAYFYCIFSPSCKNELLQTRTNVYNLNFERGYNIHSCFHTRTNLSNVVHFYSCTMAANEIMVPILTFLHAYFLKVHINVWMSRNKVSIVFVTFYKHYKHKTGTAKIRVKSSLNSLFPCFLLVNINLKYDLTILF